MSPARKAADDLGEVEKNLVRSTFMLHEKDIELLGAAKKYFPDDSRSRLIRAALRIGLPILVAERERLSTLPMDGSALDAAVAKGKSKK